MTDGSDEDTLAYGMIDVHGTEAATAYGCSDWRYPVAAVGFSSLGLTLGSTAETWQPGTPTGGHRGSLR